MRKLLLAWTLTAALTGCATVHSLDATPDEVADRIAGDAVAYNEAYGRAIADQVLLNVLRARDRLPLYHLSMSGITEGSQLQSTTTAGLGSVGLGAGGGTPWAVGSLQQQQQDTTKPTYSLNPFGSSGNDIRARQFQQASAEIFRSYWENGWPIEILFSVMVEGLDETAIPPTSTGRRTRRAPQPQARAIFNGGGAYRGDCGQRVLPLLPSDAGAAARASMIRRCEFLWLTRELADAAGPRPPLRALTDTCAQPPTPQPQRICAVQFDHGGKRYTLQLRAMDDMIYFVGSLLREIDDGRPSTVPTLTARVNIRPTDVVPADGESFEDIERTATLFRVRQLERGQTREVFAARVRYHGVHYAAGPPSGVVCIGIVHCANRAGPHNDATARVLSLLTQLVILSQSEAAQLAPRNLVQ